MSDDSPTAERVEKGTSPGSYRDDEDNRNPLWQAALEAAIEEEDSSRVAELMEPLHAADVGDVLETLDADDRIRLINLLGDRFDYTALTEIDESVRAELMERLPNADIARGVA